MIRSAALNVLIWQAIIENFQEVCSLIHNVISLNTSFTLVFFHNFDFITLYT